MHRTLGSAPREELAWLAGHGTLRHVAEGVVLASKGIVVEQMLVVLTGHIAIFVDRGAGPHPVMEWRSGDVTGVLPFSRLTNPPGDTVTLVPTTVLALHRDLLPALTRECYAVTSILVHTMLDRARHFTSDDLRDEKLASLGRLSAGLAHELNNPAAAIERSAVLLEKRLDEAERATRVLGASRLTEEQLSAIDAARVSCVASPASGVLSPIQRAERENAIADWLDDNELDSGIAAVLAETAVTLDALDALAGAVSGPALEAVLRWAAAGCTVRDLASEIQDAATRIVGLVQAIKGFTHMDQAAVAGPVDLATNLGNTVTILRSKARARSVSVAVDIEPGLPRALGFAGELNQVWANLIDNAIDAVAVSGHVAVAARRQRQQVVVSIVDDGPGIPDEYLARIFDPFFTTKPVGQGTGLGLDIVRRLLAHNKANIEVESAPGRTEFRVCLPIADAASSRSPS